MSKRKWKQAEKDLEGQSLISYIDNANPAEMCS